MGHELILVVGTVLIIIDTNLFKWKERLIRKISQSNLYIGER